MGKKRGNRKRHLLPNPAPELPNPISADNMYRPTAECATIKRPNPRKRHLLPNPAPELPNPISADSMYRPTAECATIMRPYPRKRHLLPNPAPELPNPISADNMYQATAECATIMPSNFSVSSLIPRPVQVHAFLKNSTPQRWLPSIPFWHAKSVFPPVPDSLPVAIVAPLSAARFARCGAKAGPIPSTLPAFNSVKSSSSQALTEKTMLPVAPSEKASLQVSDQTSDVGSRGTEYCTDVNVSPETDPVTMQSATDKTTESSNAEERDTVLNTESPTEDDVIFLYRVEPEKGKLIEVVNLSEDPNEISSDRNLVLMSSPNLSSNKENDMKQHPRQNLPDSQEVIEISSSTSKLEKSKGPDLRTRIGKKRKREENRDTLCIVCHRVDLNFVFISKCGHIFCMTCLKRLVPYKCTECNAGISNLSKVTF